MATLGDKFCQNSAFKFYCKYCDYGTSKRSSYNDHNLSSKHKKVTNDYNVTTNSAAIHTTNIKHLSYHDNFICSCGKEYKHRQGLWRHKKTCNTLVENKDETLKEMNDKELIQYLMKENSEFKLLMLEQSKTMNELAKKAGNNNTTNNNQFNLNFYLNDTCQNAMNITDFVSSIQFNLEDLENTGRTGYIEGISNIILKNLNQLNVTDRPIHCSDIKREVLYIKDNNEWMKETQHKPILTKAIKTIANENIKQISKWKDNYPDCIKSDSKKNDLYLKIVSNSMNGLTKEESDKNINKIITNVAKNVIIEK